MKNKILEKIKLIRDNYSDELAEGQFERLDQVERKLEELDIKRQMTDNPLFEKLRNYLKEKIKSVNHQLTTQRVRSDEDIVERETLFEKRDLYESELRTFEGAEEEFKRIEAQVDGWLDQQEKLNKKV